MERKLKLIRRDSLDFEDVKKKDNSEIMKIVMEINVRMLGGEKKLKKSWINRIAIGK